MQLSSHYFTICALTGMCAGAFVLALNSGNTLLAATGGSLFGLGFAALTTKALDKLENNK